MEDIGIVVSIVVASIACLLSIFTAIQTSRRSSIIEGRHLQEVISLKEKVALLDSRVWPNTECIQNMLAELRSIRTDIEWLKKNSQH